MKTIILYFTILFCLLLKSFYLNAVPNSGTLLNFENELNKFKEKLDFSGLENLIQKEIIKGEES